MCQRPKFYSEESLQGRFDFEAGRLGDTWFLAAISSLTLTPKFLDRVIPPEQSFDPATNYCGLFRFDNLQSRYLIYVINPAEDNVWVFNFKNASLMRYVDVGKKTPLGLLTKICSPINNE